MLGQLSTRKWHYCAIFAKSVRFGRECKQSTLLIKQTFYLQKFEAPKSYFWYTILTTQKIKVHIYFFAFFNIPVPVLCVTLWEMGSLRVL